ncbi:MAG: tRNA (adenine-N1)-methyltransferase [Chloroflexi bacterium]|nr:tRNA (adenine-N1)-methyltransferase [Chloroflexota bacterium]
MSVFAPGEMVLLVDPTGKRHLVRLAEADTLHHHLGAVHHADVIGQPEGARVRSSQGRIFTAVRPRLLDSIFEMPRKSGIVYPKDAAHLIAWADIAPGHRVLESGVGSGALTLALLRAVSDKGQVIGYEQRADFIELALNNVRTFAEHSSGNLLLREKNVYDGLVDEDLDRIVLDLPEPWHVLPHVPSALKQGGWLAAYNPSVIQVSQLVDALRATQRYIQVETHEVLLRGWHVQGAAVRPEHEMVGHTGFITVARLVAEGN